MRYLLDTHALLWSLTDPSKLGKRAREVISSRKNSLAVSAASAWEISTKHRLDRLPEADVLLRSYSRHLERLGAERLPITDEHALVAGSLGWEHRDPFDRMLVAQAIIESMPILSRDATIRDYPGVRVIW